MKAAVALSESRGGELSRVEKKLDKLDEKVLVADTRLAKVETKLDVHTWLFGLILAVVLLVLGKVLTLHG